MSTETTSKAMRWTGWGLTGLFVLFWVMDLIMKLMSLPQVAETMAQMGWPTKLSMTLGIIQMLLLILYLVPRTSVLGAVLVTAYLGGAVATHVRIGSPLFSHVLFGVYIGLFAWGGLWLRDAGLRALFPIRR